MIGTELRGIQPASIVGDIAGYGFLCLREKHDGVCVSVNCVVSCLTIVTVLDRHGGAERSVRVGLTVHDRQGGADRA